MVSNNFLFHKSKGSAMNNDLYHKRNERKVSFLYPVNGSKNVLRNVNGVKVKSFTGPSGRGCCPKSFPRKGLGRRGRPPAP